MIFYDKGKKKVDVEAHIFLKNRFCKEVLKVS